MRHHFSLAPLACGVASAIALATLAVLAPSAIQAQSRDQGGQSCTCPQLQEREQPRSNPRPRFADVRTPVAAGGETAALEAVLTALREVGDGASYIWHRADADISGVVTPVSSFKDAEGRVCRHIVVELSRASASRRTEGIACRMPSGVWQLDG